MDKEKYLQASFDIGAEPNMDKCPPDFNDLPVDVQKGIVVFGKLGDRIAADIGYLGKDMSALQVFIDLYKVEEKELFVETILILDQRMIEKSAEAMSNARRKAESKSK